MVGKGHGGGVGWSHSVNNWVGNSHNRSVVNHGSHHGLGGHSSGCSACTWKSLNKTRGNGILEVGPAEDGHVVGRLLELEQHRQVLRGNDGHQARNDCGLNIFSYQLSGQTPVQDQDHSHLDHVRVSSVFSLLSSGLTKVLYMMVMM